MSGPLKIFSGLFGFAGLLGLGIGEQYKVNKEKIRHEAIQNAVGRWYNHARQYELENMDPLALDRLANDGKMGMIFENRTKQCTGTYFEPEKFGRPFTIPKDVYLPNGRRLKHHEKVQMCVKKIAAREGWVYDSKHYYLSEKDCWLPYLRSDPDVTRRACFRYYPEHWSDEALERLVESKALSKEDFKRFTKREYVEKHPE